MNKEKELFLEKMKKEFETILEVLDISKDLNNDSILDYLKIKLNILIDDINDFEK